MGGASRIRWYFGCVVVLAQMLGSVAASAETTTERPGSILIFPKVVFDGSRDTLIRISNTTNFVSQLHCFYVNAVGYCSRSIAQSCVHDGDCGEAGTCEPQWQEIDFDVSFTKQQPTHWSAGMGRFTDSTDPVCRVDLPSHERDVHDCYGAGLDPGRIPPVSDPFVGELRCIEVMPGSGEPFGGNRFKGEATIEATDGSASGYNAVVILGRDSNDADNVLCVGGGYDPDRCPNGAEYDACPDVLILDHFSENVDNPLLGPASKVQTELTLVPCAADFEMQEPTKVTVQFSLTNEFEESFSASTTVLGWGNFYLNQINLIFDVSRLGTRVVQTRMRPASGTPAGFVGISEEYHTWNRNTGRVAFGLHQEGERQTTDLIVIPEGP